MFVGVFGVTLVLSCITGLYLYRGALKSLFSPRLPGDSSKRSWWSALHKHVGVWSLLFNLLLGATGAVLGLENLVARIEQHWLGRPPRAAAPPPVLAPGPTLPLATLLARAAAHFPEFQPVAITLPAKPGAPVLLRGDVPGLLLARSSSTLSLHPVTGAELARSDARTGGFWSRLNLAIDPLHFGYFGGWWTKIPWLFFGLAPGVLALTGFVLWRRRTQPRSAPVPVVGPHRFTRPIALAATLVAQFAALALVAHAQGGWRFSNALLEHAIAKPLALALVAFPLTWALFALARRIAGRPVLFAAACTGLAAYYASLATHFQ